MNENAKGTVFWVLGIVSVTIFLVWLTSEFRSDGILGFLQIVFSPIYILPYILGAIFGGNPHNPSDFGFALGVFLEVAGIAFLIRYILEKRKGDEY